MINQRKKADKAYDKGVAKKEKDCKLLSDEINEVSDDLKAVATELAEFEENHKETLEEAYAEIERPKNLEAILLSNSGKPLTDLAEIKDIEVYKEQDMTREGDHHRGRIYELKLDQTRDKEMLQRREYQLSSIPKGQDTELESTVDELRKTVTERQIDLINHERGKMESQDKTQLLSELANNKAELFKETDSGKDMAKFGVRSFDDLTNDVKRGSVRERLSDESKNLLLTHETLRQKETLLEAKQAGLKKKHDLLSKQTASAYNPKSEDVKEADKLVKLASKQMKSIPKNARAKVDSRLEESKQNFDRFADLISTEDAKIASGKHPSRENLHNINKSMMISGGATMGSHRDLAIHLSKRRIGTELPESKGVDWEQKHSEIQEQKRPLSSEKFKKELADFSQALRSANSNQGQRDPSPQQDRRRESSRDANGMNAPGG